jgi:hypothetical protein
MQGEEVEQQHFLALGQAADNSTEQQQSKHKAHFAELVAMAPVGSKGGRKPFLGIDQSELHKGATPQVSRPQTFPQFQSGLRVFCHKMQSQPSLICPAFVLVNNLDIVFLYRSMSHFGRELYSSSTAQAD